MYDTFLIKCGQDDMVCVRVRMNHMCEYLSDIVCVREDKNVNKHFIKACCLYLIYLLCIQSKYV